MTPRYPSTAVPSKQAGAFYACYFAVLGVVLPFLGPFLTGRGLGAVAVGLVTAAFSLAKLGYAPVLGRWVDRGGWLSGMLSLHMLLSVAAAVVVIFAEDPWVLGFAFLVIGLGYGTVLPLVEAAVLERPPSRGYGFVRWWGSAGFIACATVTAVALGGGRLDRFPVALVASLVVLTLVALTLEGEARPRHHAGDGTWLKGVVWVLLAILTLHQVAHGPYYGFFSIHLREFGVGTGMVAGLWSLAVLAEMVAFVMGADLQRRFGLRALLGFSLAVTPIRWLLLALAPTLPILVVAQIGHAVTFALAHLAGIQLVQLLVPADARRNAQALYSGLCFGLGIVVGTAAAGPIYAAVGGSGSFLIAAGFSAAVAVAWFVVAPRFGR
jgi:MFS transporter, PPP family, 3-phenylpropionic acid transporter